MEMMKVFNSALGQKSWIILRVLQALLSLLSLVALVSTAPKFIYVTSLCNLAVSQRVQVIWSCIVLCMDHKSVVGRRITAFFDLFVGVFSFASASASAAIVHLLFVQLEASCNMYLIAVGTAYFAWSLQAFLSLPMLWVVSYELGSI